jgi:Leucine Rich repeat
LDDGATKLAEALTVNQTLQEFYISSGQDDYELNLGDSTAKAIAKMLLVNQTLRTLDLGLGRITSIGVRSIAGALQTNCSLFFCFCWRDCNLQDDFNDNNTSASDNDNDNILVNQYATTGSHDGNGAIGYMLGINKTLKILKLCGSNISSNIIQSISRALQQRNDTLRKIEISNTRIEDDGMQAIADVLKINKSITHLDLSKDFITPNGAIYIANALEHNTTLLNLNLRCNRIGMEGTVLLAKALNVNETLKVLDIDWHPTKKNGVQSGDAVATFFAEMLLVNESLISLDLNVLYFSFTGLKAITVAL